MKYGEIVKECEALNYRDKLRLSQLLIQLARKEEEIENPHKHFFINNAKQSNKNDGVTNDSIPIEYVIQRLSKLRPATKNSLINSIGSMFQFQGGISEEDKIELICKLVKIHFLTVTENNRINYL
jgi:hypothetical protein